VDHDVETSGDGICRLVLRVATPEWWRRRAVAAVRRGVGGSRAWQSTREVMIGRAPGLTLHDDAHLDQIGRSAGSPSRVDEDWGRWLVDKCPRRILAERADVDSDGDKSYSVYEINVTDRTESTGSGPAKTGSICKYSIKIISYCRHDTMVFTDHSR
jgi:hypothetical protein